MEKILDKCVFVNKSKGVNQKDINDMVMDGQTVFSSLNCPLMKNPHKGLSGSPELSNWRKC